jgi:hypothetical protein
MLDLMNKMTQLSEAKEKTKTGLKHTAEPGGYGRKDDEDDEGHKVKATAVKKGKGRPKRDADDSGETKKYDFSAFGVKSGKDVKLPKHDKKKTTVVKGKSQSHADNKKDDGTDPETKAKKKGLKEYFDSLDKALNESGYTTEPMPGAVKVKDAAGNVVATAKSQQAAEMFKKGDVTLGGSEEMHEGDGEGIGALPKQTSPEQPYQVPFGTDTTLIFARGKRSGLHYAMMRGMLSDPWYFKFNGKVYSISDNGDGIPKPIEQGMAEADQPSNQMDMGAGLGAGRSQATFESRAKADNKAEKAGKKVTKDLEYDMKHKGKDDEKAEKAGKKVTKDIEYDEKKKVKEAKDLPGNQDKLDVAEPKGKLDAKDFKELSKKKKVKEGMEHKLKAARHTGKAHALSKQGYNCGYDDMEESRHYHEGYKEGLDECYGQQPVLGLVGEANNEVADMASYGAHTPTMEDDMYEMDKTSYMKQQAIKTPGNTFKAFGQTFKDKEVVESPFAFEAWEKELNSILEGKDVTEGMTVSISKGQQGTPDSVSVSAQDSEADQLLSIIKQSGLGLFGGDDVGQPQATSPMTVDVDGGEGPQANIEVVDDHDDMLSLIRKMTGQGPAQAAGDYEEEGGEEMQGHEHGQEETCESCGSTMQEGHSCGEAVEEDETLAQREEVVGEEINPNNNDEAEEEQSDATRDAALAQAAGKNFADTDAPLEEGGDGGETGDEDLEESLANSADDTFEADIDFMTNVITDGLNGRKRDVAGNGQSTIPAVATTRESRLGSPMKESTDLLHDWRKLSGIR